jgi:hypothetical protein
MARYIRNLGDKPVLNMSGRFHESWGDFGGLRTEPSLEYDCINGVANGMRPTVGDHFHPRGDINQPMFDLIKGIYGRLQKLEPWIDGARPVTELAVIFPEDNFNFGIPESSNGILAAYGISRLLCELKYQFDILTADLDFTRYKVLILADCVPLTNGLDKRIKAFLANGGKIISTGRSGLDGEGKDFALSEWGVKFKGESPHDPAYMAPPSGKLAAGFPDMPVTLYERGIDMDAIAGTEVLAEIIAPYYNSGFDGEHAFLYLPPDKKTGKPAITRKGNVVHFSHSFCINYYKHAQVPMKALFGNILAELLPAPIVKVTNMPSFARVTVSSQPGRTMVYLMSYVPEKRGDKIEMIEEAIAIHGAKLAVRLDGARPRKVYLAPEGKELSFIIKNNYTCVDVPAFSGYALIVFENCEKAKEQP